jgi:hypothetical protein
LDTVDDRTAEAAYEASVISGADFGRGWRLLTEAFDMATTDLQLQYIGAGILEALFHSFPAETSAAAVKLLREQPRFVSVLSTASLSGAPAAAWVPVNEALRAAGAAERLLID